MLLLLLTLIQSSPQRDDGQWTMPARDYAATRYSGLNQITPANAAHLKPVWTFSTGVLGGHEGQPLVVDKTMYVVPIPGADRVPFGLTVPEIAGVMGALGAQHAMLLDGGISAQLTVTDSSGRARAWKGLRRVPLALVAYH